MPLGYYIHYEPHPFSLLHAEIEASTRLQKAKILLDHGGNPNIADKFGWTVVHQCAYNGDLPLMEMLVRKGANIRLRNRRNQLPVEIAAIRGHAPLVQYLEEQSCDLKSLCRLAIRDAMGKRTYNRINELPLPSLLKLFINYGNPYNGWEAILVPPTPWSNEELQEGRVKPQEVRSFICENACEDFLEEHAEVLKGKNGTSLPQLIEAFQSLYLWEEFKTVNYQEPPARTPRYKLEKLKEEQEVEYTRI